MHLVNTPTRRGPAHATRLERQEIRTGDEATATGSRAASLAREEGERTLTGHAGGADIVTPEAGGRVGDGAYLAEPETLSRALTPPGGVTAAGRGKHRRRDETRLERRAREAVEEMRQTPAHRAAVAAHRDALLARRRRTVLIIGVVGVSLCVLVTAASAWVASGFDGDHLTWWIALSGRRSHWDGEYSVATDSAAWFALTVTAVPVLLAALSYLALRLPDVREKTWATAPAWVGASLMAGLAVGVLASFVGSRTGQRSGDLLPIVAGVAPQGLALLVLAAVLVLRERRRRTPQLEALG